VLRSGCNDVPILGLPRFVYGLLVKLSMYESKEDDSLANKLPLQNLN
jgi:hypothetical protein